MKVEWKSDRDIEYISVGEEQRIREKSTKEVRDRDKNEDFKDRMVVKKKRIEREVE